MAAAAEQEMVAKIEECRAQLVAAEAEVPKAMADAFRSGNMGVMDYYKSKQAYLQGQIGNPDGEDSPNKKHYDPRVWLRKSEQSMTERLKEAFEDLNCVDRF